MPVFRGRYEGFGDLVLDGGATNVYAFIGYVPNTNLMDAGSDWGHMFITQDHVCDGTKWHQRDIPADPADDPYFPIDQASLTLTPEGAVLRADLKTFTPNFKTYVARFDGADWKPVGQTFTWACHPGDNQLEVKAVNRFGIDGPVSSAHVMAHAAANPAP